MELLWHLVVCPFQFPDNWQVLDDEPVLLVYPELHVKVATVLGGYVP